MGAPSFVYRKIAMPNRTAAPRGQHILHPVLRLSTRPRFEPGRRKSTLFLPAKTLPGPPYPSSSSNALCSARTAAGTCASSIKHVIRISLVVISSMLIPASYSVWNIRPA